MFEQLIVSSPPALFAFLASIVALVHFLARRGAFAPFFRYGPPLIWSYFVPMICSSLGIIPSSSPLYTFMMRVMLPVIVVLLLVGSDTAAIARIGRKGVAMMLIGTLGIVAGAIGSFALFRYLLPPGTLPPNLWKGMAALAGSWIGGSPNMAAVAGSLGLEQSALFGKMVVVDTVCAYTWLGILIAGVAWQERFDRFNRTDSRLAVHAISGGDFLHRYSTSRAGMYRRPLTTDARCMPAPSQACRRMTGGPGVIVSLGDHSV